MARLSAPAELDALRRQQVELAQKIKAAEVKAREKARADQDRREKLLGRILLAHIAEHPDDDASRAVIAILDASVPKIADRALFGLPVDSKAADIPG